jgi:chitinase
MRLFFQRADSSGDLYYAVGDGVSWSSATAVPNVKLSGSPAAVVFNNLLYLFYESPSNTGWIHWCTFDGSKWSDDAPCPNASDPFGTSGAPAVIAYNGKIYMFHAGQGDSGDLWFTSFDGNSWTKDQRAPGILLSASPAVEMYNGLIWILHQGFGNSGWVWAVPFDGENFMTDALIPDSNLAYGCSQGVSVCQFEGNLVVAHEGRKDDIRLWRSFNECSKPRVNKEIPLLDVWGEGRVLANGLITGFWQALNLNKFN